MSLHSAWLLLSLITTTVNKEGRDITTIQASVGPRIHFSEQASFAVGDLRVALQSCENGGEGWLDCTEAFRRELSQNAGYETVVLLRPLLIPSQGASCSLIDIKSLMRRAVWQNKNFQGLGFYADGHLSFIEQSQLLVQKDVFLLNNNEPALVHGFVDVGLCGGASYDFKAYVQFEGPAAETVTRVWENQPQNYRLSPAQRGFDRTLDIIRP